MNIQVSDCSIYDFKDDPDEPIARCNVTINKWIRLNRIKIFEDYRGRFISMPDAEGSRFFAVSIESDEAKKKIEQKILNKYTKALFIRKTAKNNHNFVRV